MCLYLEAKWNTEIAYTCESCLEHAYYCAIQNKHGYVSDEDLAATSRRKLSQRLPSLAVGTCHKKQIKPSNKNIKI